jgi:hypothetical protein
MRKDIKKREGVKSYLYTFKVKVKTIDQNNKNLI